MTKENNRWAAVDKKLAKMLSTVNLSEKRVKALAQGAMGLAHYKDHLKAIYWYNILSGELEYSETATTHQDRNIFKAPFESDRGWIRGRVFSYKGKYYIVAYIEDWLEFPLTNRVIESLYSKIQKKCSETITDIVDEEGYSLSENKKQ